MGLRTVSSSAPTRTFLGCESWRRCQMPAVVVLSAVDGVEGGEVSLQEIWSETV